MEIVVAESAGLGPDVIDRLRRLWSEAFDDFSDDDAGHAFGGVHVLALADGSVIAHASAVPRRIMIGEAAYDAGYVEAVATIPPLQRTGLGTAVMRRLQTELTDRWQLGALSTGEHGFYERLGWERWRGPSYVATVGGTVRTPEEDDGLMVLRWGPCADVDLAASITCEERPGDAW